MNSFYTEFDKKLEEIVEKQLSKKLKNIQNEVLKLSKTVENLNGNNYVKKEDLKETTAQIMLELTPSYNERIARDIKKHLSSIAEFTLEKFNE